MHPAKPASARVLAHIAAVPLLLSLGLIAVLAGPQSAAGHLWIAQSNGLLNVATDSGELRFEIPQSSALAAVAVNDVTGDVWAYGNKELLAWSRLGQPLVRVATPPSTHGGDPVDLVVDARGNNLWMAVKRDLYRFDPQGQLRSTLTSGREIVALSMDRNRSRLWLATTSELHAYDLNGARILAMDLGRPASSIVDMAYDVRGDAVWVVFADRLQRYDAANVLALEVAGDFGGALAVDGAGGAWLMRDRLLRHVSATGDFDAMLEPFSGFPDKTIVDAVADPGDASVWVASARYIRHYGADGALLHHLAPELGDGVVRRLRRAGLYTDLDPPELDIVAPPNGALLATNRPPIELAYSDTGVGVATTLIAFRRDGLMLDVACEAGAREATCQLSSALPEGDVHLSVTVADLAGNVSAPAELHIVVDTVPPAAPAAAAISVEQLPEGRIAMTGAAGAVEGGSTVRITNTRTGQSVTVTAAADGSFTAVIAGEPGDELSVAATDRAGNSGPAVTVELPAAGGLTILQPADGATVPMDRVVVSGILERHLNAAVSVNGIAATTLAEPDVLRFYATVPLSTGSNAITATAVLQDGRSVTHAISVQRTVPTYRLTIDQTSGLAPLKATFRVATNATGLLRIEYDFDGNGTVDRTNFNLTSASYTYSSHGIYAPRVDVYRFNQFTRRYELMQRHIASVAVFGAAQLQESLELVLRAVWTGMTTALMDADVARALTAFSPSSRPQYEEVFETLRLRMHEIIGNLTQIERLRVGDEIAEVAVMDVRGGYARVHLIGFIKDSAGFWRIDSM